MTNVAVYGTLRYGLGNYRGTLSPKFPSGIVRLEGYDMYDLGGFPFIIEGEGTITVELFDDIPAEVEAHISRMEIGAGYEEVQIELNGKEYNLYVYPKDMKTDSYTKIKLGDYNLHLARKYGRM